MAKQKDTEWGVDTIVLEAHTLSPSLLSCNVATVYFSDYTCNPLLSLDFALCS